MINDDLTTIKISSINLELRKPELFEIVIAIFSATIFILLLLGYLNQVAAIIFPPLVIYIISGIWILSLTGLMFEKKASIRYGFLAILPLISVLILEIFENYSLSAQMALVFITMIQFCLRLSSIAAGVVSGSLFIFFFFSGLTHPGDFYANLTNMLVEVLVFLLIQYLMYYRERLVNLKQVVKFQNHSLENLSKANQSFIAHIEDVREDSAEKERFRITRELHDSIGYSMTNVAMMMNASRHLIYDNPEKLMEYCNRTKIVASETLRETRNILYKLRDISEKRLYNPPLFFIRLCRDFNSATDVRTDCNIGNLPEVLNERIFNILFRAVQVGFINALRHGNASQIKLGFWLSETELSMTIWNDMREPLSVDSFIEREGIGLKGIRERLEELDGQLSAQSAADGFRLIVTIPKKSIIEASNENSDS